MDRLRFSEDNIFKKARKILTYPRLEMQETPAGFIHIVALC